MDREWAYPLYNAIVAVANELFTAKAVPIFQRMKMPLGGMKRIFLSTVTLLSWIETATVSLALGSHIQSLQTSTE